MISRFLRHPRARQGQTIVLFALMSLVLIAGLGLVIDAGVNYAQRRIMQNAADIAAITGARTISQQVVLSPPRVRTAVLDAAEANGAARANVTCDFIDTDRNILGSCNDGTPNIAVTGVRVRVTEQHTTIFMRAIGIQTSGTAASSVAEVQVVTSMLTSDVLMAVCGVETKTSGGGIHSILTTTFDEKGDPLIPRPSPTASPSPMPVATDPTSIQPSAYSYDWNTRVAATGAFPSPSSGAPEFVIQGANVAKCRQPADWNGLMQVDVDAKPMVLQDADAFIFSHAFARDSGDLPNGSYSPDAGEVCPDVRSGPCRTINGPMGCTRWQNPDGGCVMILPIIDNHRSSNLDVNLYARAWGAFVVTKVGSEYRGRMIKNYPMHADSIKIPGWSRDYNGPISITLVSGT